MTASRRDSIVDSHSRFWTDSDVPRPSTYGAEKRKPTTPIRPARTWAQSQRKRQLEAVLVFSAAGLLLVSSNFALWVLWPCIALALVSIALWVNRNFFS